MTVDYMRDQIRTMYTTKTWSDRVDRMRDQQVVAIYRSWIERIAKAKKKEINDIFVNNRSSYHQMTISEYLAEKEKH